MHVRLSGIGLAAWVTITVSACRTENSHVQAPADPSTPGPSDVASSADVLEIGSRSSIDSEVLAERRDIFVSLPESYHESRTRYPVLVVLDGEAHFVHLAALVRFLAQAGEMPPAIVVGIPNTDRLRDFTPPGTPEAGRADDFLRFLAEELRDHIEHAYRTAPHWVLIGHSSAGLLATYALATRPRSFQSYVILSATLFWNDEAVLGRIDEMLTDNASLAREVYVAVSCCESATGLIQRLESHAPRDLRWNFATFADESHASVVHPAAAAGLEMIFQPWADAWKAGAAGIDGLREHLDALSQRWGYAVAIEPAQAVVLAWRAMDDGQPDAGITMLQYAIEAAPDEPLLRAFLGTFYLRAGQVDEAVETLETAVEQARVQSSPELADFQRELDHARSVRDSARR